MTGVKKLSSYAATLLICNATVAAPPIVFDGWSASSGDIADVTCPTGWVCSQANSGDGFFQRQISDGSQDFFQTIVTDKEVTSGENVKASWVGQDTANVDGVFQELGFIEHENLTTPGLIDTFSLAPESASAPAEWLESAPLSDWEPYTTPPEDWGSCYSTPNGTDTSSGFVPAPVFSSPDNFSAVTITTTAFKTDFTPPAVIAPAGITATVKGHANFINLDPTNGGVLPEVSDDQTENFDFSDTENVVVGPLPPGRHSLIWKAMDNAGNLGSDEQLIDILPTVNFEADQITTEGKGVTVTAYLNGEAAEYPVSIPFTVAGTATSGEIPSLGTPNPDNPGDHNAADGVITIDSGTVGQVSFTVAADDITDGAGEVDETVIFTMGTPNNAAAGHKTQHTVTITETPQTLILDFAIAQNDQITPLVTTDNGLITVTAIPTNRNYSGLPVYDWSQSNSSLVSAECDQARFFVDPTNLSPGLYRIHVTASEPGLPDYAASAEWWLRVGTAPVLARTSDQDNDGVPDELDIVTSPHLIPGYRFGSYKSLEGKIVNNQNEATNGGVGWSITSTEEHINYPMLIVTEPGLKLGAGSVHLWEYEYTSSVAIDWRNFSSYGHTFGVEPLTNTPIKLGDRPIQYFDLPNPLYDFNDPIQSDSDQFMVSLEISHLPKAGTHARIVIPQATAAESIEGYTRSVRTYSPTFGWQDFLEDSDNQFASAVREGDYCPPPGSDQYQLGLIDDFECLQLTIQDGGANDADGYRNGRISFNGGVLPYREVEDEMQTSELIVADNQASQNLPSSAQTEETLNQQESVVDEVAVPAQPIQGAPNLEAEAHVIEETLTDQASNVEIAEAALEEAGAETEDAIEINKTATATQTEAASGGAGAMLFISLLCLIRLMLNSVISVKTHPIIKDS